MTNPFKNQYTADGIATDFVYNFAVPINRSVLVYQTLTGNPADEDADLVSKTLYTIIPDNPTAPTSTGIVRFNAAPADQSVITITPDQETLVTYVFSNTAPFNTDNLNGSFEQEAQTNGYNLQNFLENSIRYNVNENDGNINYDNKVSPLADNGFWRRIGAAIVSQDFDEFVGEVSAIVVIQAEEYVNAGADNTNLSHTIASNDQGVQYSGNPKRVDPITGNVINDPLIQGFSAKAGALWAKAWAESANQINDDYGNSGRSARFYSDQASIAASSAGGVIDQLRIFNNVSTTTQIDLINYDANEPWFDVLENSLSVYLDGVRLQEPTAYSPPSTPATSEITYTVTIKDPPTLGDPSFITFDSPVPVSTEIYVTRSDAQGNGSTMFRRFDNALPSPETDLNTPISKAPLWGAKSILDGATSSGDWSGGYSVVVDDGVDSAAVQMQITHESDSTPEMHVRSNLTTGSTTLNPANFSSWYKGLTMDANFRVKQDIRRLRFDHSQINVDQTEPKTSIQAYKISSTNVLAHIIDAQGVGTPVFFNIAKRNNAGSVFNMFRIQQTSDAQGAAQGLFYGDMFSGPAADRRIPNIFDFQFNGATSGYLEIPTAIGQPCIIQWGTRTGVSRDTNYTDNFPLTFPNAVLTISLTLGPLISSTTAVTPSVTGQPINNSQLQYRVVGPQISGMTVRWIAIGF